jgi:hypothetical protein
MKKLAVTIASMVGQMPPEFVKVHAMNTRWPAEIQTSHTWASRVWSK